MSANPQLMQMLLAQSLMGQRPQQGSYGGITPATGPQDAMGNMGQLAQRLMLMRALQQRNQQPQMQVPPESTGPPAPLAGGANPMGTPQV